VRKSLFMAVCALVLAASSALAYVVKLKDGSLIFARTKYTVKGDKAIITLENGTVTAIKLDQVDVEGSDQYNKENFGNVVAIDTPESRKPTAVPNAAAAAVPRLQDYPSPRSPPPTEKVLRSRRSTSTSSPPSPRSLTARGSRSTSSRISAARRGCSSRRTPRKPSSTR
jgi:hypothetical protein